MPPSNSTTDPDSPGTLPVSKYIAGVNSLPDALGLAAAMAETMHPGRFATVEKETPSGDILYGVLPLGADDAFFARMVAAAERDGWTVRNIVSAAAKR